MSREYTEGEVKYNFIKHVVELINYWEMHGESKRDALEGLAFSILSTIDGSAADLPAFILAPDTNSEEYVEYCIKEGIDYYPSIDIRGSLHEYFHNVLNGDYDDEKEI